MPYVPGERFAELLNSIADARGGADNTNWSTATQGHKTTPMLIFFFLPEIIVSLSLVQLKSFLKPVFMFYFSTHELKHHIKKAPIVRSEDITQPIMLVPLNRQGELNGFPGST